MKNEIADRIAFFLKDFPPFSYLNYAELEKIATKVTVRFLEEKEVLFEEGNPGKECCFVLRKGNIKLTQVEKGNMSLIDQCEPGDIFGVRSILSNNSYVMSAICEEESLVYEIPKDIFLFHLNNNHQFSFFFTSGYAAGQAIARIRKQNQKFYIKNTDQTTIYSKQLLTCNKELPIKEAAQQMKAKNVGSIIVIDQGLAVGIVTDKDFRNKVATGDISTKDSIQKIMSSPVKSIQPNFATTDVLIKMMRLKTHHLLVTKDGTHLSQPIGIVSNHDLLVSQNNHPTALIKQLRKANEPKKWTEIRNQAEIIVEDYLHKELSAELISNFITEINDTLIKKAIDYGLTKVDKAQSINFSWLSLGSEGREEQLLRTDQDNAILFDNDHPNTQSILLELAGIVNEVLAECRFEECPANIMARNPAYNLSLSSWQQKFSHWIRSPDPAALMNATIFFDFREVYGNGSLSNQLQSYLSDEIKKEPMFLNHLAANALQNPPPLSFFKNFLVEKSGEHIDQFDIKKRGMMPLSDIARVLSLQNSILSIQNTGERFKKLADIDNNNHDLYLEASQAYHMMMQIRAKHGLKNKNSGRFIEIEDMNKLEKQILKSAFSPIKELQDMMETRFQLAYFR